jgi:magnesium-transporting ATPase (P-type)
LATSLKQKTEIGMKKANFKNKTTEKLEGELKAIKIIASMLFGVLTLLLITSIYGLLTQENNSTFIALIVVAISLGAILPLQFVNMKKIKDELKLRKDN